MFKIPDFSLAPRLCKSAALDIVSARKDIDPVHLLYRETFAILARLSLRCALRRSHLKKKETALQTTGDKKHVFYGPKVHRLNMKKKNPKAQTFFSAFQVPFWFPALRSPALSSAMVVVAFHHHLHNNATSLLSFSSVFFPTLCLFLFIFFHRHWSFVLFFLFFFVLIGHLSYSFFSCRNVEHSMTVTFMLWYPFGIIVPNKNMRDIREQEKDMQGHGRRALFWSIRKMATCCVA